jgi:mRNA interferase RelE/StbE
MGSFKKELTPYRLLYHPQFSDDLKHLDPSQQEIIVHVITHRLSHNPQKYSRPLKKNLRGLWRYRVGDYRIIFRISEDYLRILTVMRRNVVYNEAGKRKNWVN